MNAGRQSKQWLVHIKISSEGVIYGGRLWFWSRKIGYQRSDFVKGQGRPALHHVIWETAHGRPVPPHSVIRFADGNPNNLDPANLRLATRNDLARENQAAHATRSSREALATLLNLNQHSSHDTTSLLNRLKPHAQA
jgi:hypothetical protein